MISRDKPVLAEIENDTPLPNNLSKEQWRELLIDLAICSEVTRKHEYPKWEDSQRLQAVFPATFGGRPGDSSIDIDVMRQMEDLLPIARKRLCEAMDNLAQELISGLPDTKPVLVEVLGIGCHLGLDGDLAMRIVGDTSLDIDIRDRAAPALLERSFRNSAPLSFWDGINTGVFPSLLPIVMAALNEKDLHVESIEKIERVQRKPDQKLPGLVYPLREAMEGILTCVNGEQTLDQMFSLLPAWSKEYVREALTIMTNLTDQQRHTLTRALQ